MENLKYWVWLSLMSGVGTKNRCRLIEHFGFPWFIWDTPEEVLKGIPFMTNKMLQEIKDRKIRKDAGVFAERIRKTGMDIVTICDDVYPDKLKNIYDPPVVLYVKGKLKKSEDAIGIVGSRNATHYGMATSRELAFKLAAAGLTVVSGMARGIDSSAHRGALEAGGRTIAVLGCGLDVVYPPENRLLMEMIGETGAVVSEYPPGVRPLKYNFPMRNRIISGMSAGVVVVEAGKGSGSLITADFALEQGREVFAVPGNVDSSKSWGTNRLIRDGARVVTGIEDIFEELNLTAYEKGKPATEGINVKEFIFKEFDHEERIIGECLLEQPMHIDSIARKSGMSIERANSTLLMMELKGLVEQTKGRIYKLKCKI
jgi:DNA processing protein